jgi:hypothetical protein
MTARIAGTTAQMREPGLSGCAALGSARDHADRTAHFAGKRPLHAHGFRYLGFFKLSGSEEFRLLVTLWCAGWFAASGGGCGTLISAEDLAGFGELAAEDAQIGRELAT